MTEERVSYSCDEGEEQCASWKTDLDTFVEAARPDTFELTGAAAASIVEPALDLFVTTLNENFDDNHELGKLIHNVMVGHGEKMIAQDNATAKQDGEG